MLTHIHQILKLLESRFPPDKDIPQIARKLWNSSERAFNFLKDDSLGPQFLNSFAPCGKSLVKEGPCDNSQKMFEAKSNLQIAHDILTKWVTEVPNNKDSYSAPWTDKFLVDSENKKAIENKTSWSTSLEGINEWSHNNRTNRSVFHVLFSFSFDDKFLIRPMKMLFGQVCSHLLGF